MNETFDELNLGCRGARPGLPKRRRAERTPGPYRLLAAHSCGCICTKGYRHLVGSSGYHNIEWEIPKFEIGYWCRKRFMGQGYITEAVRALTALAFDILGARRVQICMDTLNDASRRVAERVGYVFESEQPNERTSGDGKVRSTYVYRLIPEEYRELVRSGRLLSFAEIGDNPTVKPVRYRK